MAVFKLGMMFAALLLAACTTATTVPRVELDAYIGSYDKLQQTTNTVLDLVAPFEREVIRSVAAQPGSGAGGDCPTGRNSYCYALRDAWATIGDPPLVKSIRRSTDVLLRFNKLLSAYASSASVDLLRADYARLQARIGPLAGLAASAPGNIGPAITIAKQLGTAAAEPLLGAADRAQFGVYLRDNRAAVDEAFGLLAESSEVLYGNVSSATDLRKRAAANAAERAALDQRREQLRQILANWTVLIDNARVQLNELAWASANPDNMETRLRNLGNLDSETNANAAILNREILLLIGGFLGAK